MLLFAPRVTHVDTLWVHVGVKSFHSQNFVIVLAMYIPVRGNHWSTPIGRPLALLSRGSVKSNFLVRFTCRRVLEAVIRCQVLIQYRVCSVVCVAR
jgi:hypothetical protein